MGDVILGLETEFGSTLSNPRGRKLSTRRGVAAALDLARESLPCWLRDTGASGIFMGNGGRLYLDGHLEYSTPETKDPADLVRHVLAGDRLLENVIIPGLVQKHGYGEAKFYRNNSCYFSGNTFGCHENYGTKNRNRNFQSNLLPHLCSRNIFSGSGGFDARRRDLRFLLSARVAHIETVVSENSTNGRPLYHTKNEPHTQGKGLRIHIICGDSQRSSRALYRRVGTTGLVVALIDAGHEPGADVVLVDPLHAVKAFAEDPTCTLAVPLKAGGEITAKEIQFHYLAFAEAHLADLPDWAPEFCREWRQVLEVELREGAATAACDIEWAMKYRLFSGFAAKHGITLDGSGNWAPLLSAIAEIFERRGEEVACLSAKQVRALRSPPADSDLHHFENALRQHGREFEELLDYLKVRDSLLELDTRWTEIGEDSLYSQICRGAGIVDEVPGVDPETVGEAINIPPKTTRAHVRGNVVAKLGTSAEGRTAFRCNWGAITNYREQKVMGMDDPFDARLDGHEWTAAELPTLEDPGIARMMQERVNRILQLYDRGAVEEAAGVIREVRGMGWGSSGNLRKQFLRYSAWVHIRRGALDDATEALQQLSSIQRARDHTDYLSDCILVNRHAGLRPSEGIRPFLAQAVRHIHSRRGDVPRFFSASVYSHLGYYTTVSKGMPEKGLNYLRRARRSGGDGLHTFPRNRLFCDFARSFTMLGKKRDALYWLYHAKGICDTLGYRGEHADYVLSGLGRANADNPSRAMGFLEEAVEFQQQTESRVGEARSLLLQARILGEPGGGRRERLLQLRGERSVLQRCGLLGRILDQWEEFTGGGRDPEGIDDDFWSV